MYLLQFISGYSCDNCVNQAANSVISSTESLVNVLESIAHFVGRLKIYTGVPLSSAMVEIVVQIMVELISVLALETKKFTQRRLSKFGRPVH